MWCDGNVVMTDEVRVGGRGGQRIPSTAPFNHNHNNNTNDDNERFSEYIIVSTSACHSNFHRVK